MVTLRPARASDASAIAELGGELGYPITVSEAASRLARVLDSGRGIVFVADTADDVIGWVMVHEVTALTSPPHAEIAGLVVAARSRNQGVGQQLVVMAERWAEDRGLSVLRLRANITREDAHRFYERIGFEKQKVQQVFSKPLDPCD